jgi:hypothetical protein
MDIVDKTRTRIMHQIMGALGVGRNLGYTNDAGIIQRSPEEIDEQIEWHDKQGKWVVTTTVTVKTTKRLVVGQGDTL